MFSALKEWLFELGRWLAAPRDLAEDSEDWYAGLAVDPCSFSDQLCKLQNSLRGEGSAGEKQQDEVLVKLRSPPRTANADRSASASD